MVLSGENRRTRRKTCHSATLSIEIPYGLTWYRNEARNYRKQYLNTEFVRHRTHMASPLKVILQQATKAQRWS